MFIYVLINLGFEKNGNFKKLICMPVCFDYVGLTCRYKTACMQIVYLMLVIFFIKKKMINLYVVEVLKLILMFLIGSPCVPNK